MGNGSVTETWRWLIHVPGLGVGLLVAGALALSQPLWFLGKAIVTLTKLWWYLHGPGRNNVPD